MLWPQTWRGDPAQLVGMPANDFWHALPVVAGFLLAAVCDLDQPAATRGWRLPVLFGMWLVARLVLGWRPSGAVCGLGGGNGVYRDHQHRTRRAGLGPAPVAVYAVPAGTAGTDAARFGQLPVPGGPQRLPAPLRGSVDDHRFIVIIGGRVTVVYQQPPGAQAAATAAVAGHLAIGSIIAIGLVSAFVPRKTSPWLAALCLASGASGFTGWRAGGMEEHQKCRCCGPCT